jgi:hypothetical protein
MADEDDIFNDLPKLEDDDKGKSKDKAGGDDDLIELEEDDPIRALMDDEDDNPENAPKTARSKDQMQEIVFHEDDEEDDGGDIEDFTNRGDPDKKKLNRLQREIRLKNEARQNGQKLLNVVSESEKAATEALRAEARTRRGTADMVMNFASTDIRRLNAELAQAKEDGNGDRIGELTEKLSEARNAYDQAKGIRDSLSDEKIEAIRYRADVPRMPKMTKGQDWIDQNPWFNDPKFAAEKAAAIEIDKQLIAAGGNIDSDDHFLNLTKRIAQKFPSLTSQGLLHTNDGRVARLTSDGGRKRGGSGKRDITGGGSAIRAGGTSQTRSSSDGKEHFSKSERRFLERMGVDLTDKETREEYKRNMIR